MDDQDQNPSEQKTTAIVLYIAFIISIALTFIPSFSAAFLAIVAFVAVLITAYSMRSKHKGALAGDHAHYIIRTIWISSFFSLITMAIASFYMIPNIDYSAFESCANALTSHIDINNPDIQTLIRLTQPCNDNFIQNNYALFLNATLIAAAPLGLYVILRLFKGVIWTQKGQSPENPKSWF